MTSSPIVILLISGGSAVAMNVMAALDTRRALVHLAATNSVADAPGLFEFDEVFLVPDTLADEELFDSHMEDIFDRTKPDLVIPCRDDDVLWLAKKAVRSPKWAQGGLCGPPELAEVIVNKHSSAHFCRKHGLPFAPSIALDAPVDSIEDFMATYGFPLIVKPSRGFASRGVLIVKNSSQLRRHSGTKGMIAQQFLGSLDETNKYLDDVDSHGVPLFHSFEGDKTSIQVLISPDGAVSGVFATRNTMRRGRSERIEIENDKEVIALANRCAEVFARQGWRGPLNIQCLRSLEGEILITEFNGRFTGATAARCLMGYDEVGLAINAYTRSHLPRDRNGDRPETVVRLPTSCAAREHLAEHLAREKHWRRSSSATASRRGAGEDPCG